MALCGSCFGLTKCPSSQNNYPSTFYIIYRTQYTVKAFYECTNHLITGTVHSTVYEQDILSWKDLL
jgi:hypothetical protein